jgi:nucleoside-diphosphate-sugar epimerase
MKAPRTLVSGGTGIVGRFVVESLLDAGHAVTVMGRNAPEQGFFTRPVRFLEGSLDPDREQRAIFQDINNFVHAAFDHLPGRYRGGEGEDAQGFRRRNLEGAVALFEAARERGVGRAVFLSSRAVYGDHPGTWTFTERSPTPPETLYGQVKLAAEEHLDRMIDDGWAGGSLRITGVYGPAAPGREHKWSGLIQDYLAGREIEPRIGTEVHGGDVGQAVLLMLTTEQDQLRRLDRAGMPAAGSAFNVSDPVVDRRDVLAIVQEETGCRHPLPEPADRAALNVMATDKLRALGWKPGGWPLLEKTVREMAAREGS